MTINLVICNEIVNLMWTFCDSQMVAFLHDAGWITVLWFGISFLWYRWHFFIKDLMRHADLVFKVKLSRYLVFICSIVGMDNCCVSLVAYWSFDCKIVRHASPPGETGMLVVDSVVSMCFFNVLIVESNNKMEVWISYSPFFRCQVAQLICNWDQVMCLFVWMVR